jgi:hypothetical protein
MTKFNCPRGSVTNSLKYKFGLQVCGQLTSQNKDQTQAPTSSGTDNSKVIKHMHKTEEIKHMSNSPRVAPIRCCRHLKGREHMYKRKRLELSYNNNSFIKFVFKQKDIAVDVVMGDQG